MSTPLTVVLAVCFLHVSCFDGTAQSAALGLYNEGNADYRSGDFEIALSKYQEVVESGVSNPQLYYNMGNANFKLNRIGEAILWYERALRLAPRDQDVISNLQFADRVKKDRQSEGPENPVWQTLVGIYRYPTVNELSLLFAGGVLLLVAIGSWRLLNVDRAGTAWLVLMSGIGLATVCAGTLMTGRIYGELTTVEAIVTAEEGVARSAPDHGRTAVFVIHEGTKVSVSRAEGDWMLIRLSNGLGGWLPSSTITVI